MATFRTVMIMFFVVTISTFYAVGQPLILLNNSGEMIDVGRSIFFLEDPNHTYSLDNVLSDSLQSKFTPCQRDIPNFSSTASAYWLKLRVRYQVDEPHYLQIGSAFMDSISVYHLDTRQQLIDSRFSGDDLPFGRREVAVNSFLFRLNGEPGQESIFYIRVESTQPLFFPVRVGKLEAFVEFVHDLDFIQGVYFGLMLIMFFYNLFLYFSIKEKLYLYYIAYVFCMSWFMGAVFGYYFEYFWPNWPLLNKYAVVSSALTMISATVFTQRFLETKNFSLVYHRITFLFIALGVIACVLLFFGDKIIGLKLVQAGLLLMAVYFLFIGFKARLNDYKPATYYLLAWGALILGIVFAILESLNLLPVMRYVNAMQIGSALEVVLLSFALGARINSYKHQKEKAQESALLVAREKEQLIQEQNRKLEIKVADRTQEIAQRNEELIALNKEKDGLMSVVAHDLRTPLNQIRGLIQLIHLSDANQLSEDQRHYLTQMDTSADRLTHMISRILNVNAIESKEISLKTEILDLKEVVTYVIKCFHITADAKNIELLFESNDGEHLAEVDKNYLIQVLENLISNAIKFSDRGTQVYVRVLSSDAHTSIEVEDFGPGISEEDQKKMFGRFQRLSASPTAGEISTGLGLSIAKKYIEAMNGSIVCQSQLEVGTKFVVAFDTAKQLVEVD